MKKSIVKPKTVSMPAALAIGIGVSILVTVVMCALFAWLISQEAVGESIAGYSVLATLIISCASGGAVSSGLIRQRRMIICLATGGLYLMFLLASTALLFEGQYSGVWVTIVTVLGASVCIGMIGGKKTPRNRIKKGAYR